MISGISMRAFIITSILILLSIQPISSEDNRECPSHHEGPIAIFIDPTDEDVERMKKDNGEDVFYTIADDSLYYKWEAVEFLSKNGISYWFTKNEEHEFTAKESNSKYSIKKECAGWCLILFNGKGEPEWASAVDIFMYEKYLKGVD
jgi:hypothetical protein